MFTSRRAFLGFVSSSSALAALPSAVRGAMGKPAVADLRLRIEQCVLEIAKGVSISTVAYNGQVPGPLLRLKRGKPVSIDVTNATNREDLVHWHGLHTDPLNDGAVEEGSLLIKPGATLRYNLTPEPSGTRTQFLLCPGDGPRR